MTNDQRYRDQQRTAGAQMREEGMPQGQSPARASERPMTSSQRAQHEAGAILAQMIADVERNKAEIVTFLGAFGIEYDFFVAGLRIFLVKQQRERPDFFSGVNPSSFMEACLRIAMNGLIPDGKEAAIAVYKGVAQSMFMRDGFVKVLWRTGMVQSINDNVVTVSEEAEGRFEYEEGTDGFIRHRPSMMRTDKDESIAAYCVIKLVGGGEIREVVAQDELFKIRKMSKSPARGEWKFQMDRKAAIRRAMGKLPREKGIAQLLAHDDLSYDVNAVAASAEDGERAVPKAKLFSNRVARPARPAKQQAQAETQHQEEPALEEGADDQHHPAPVPETAAEIIVRLDAVDNAVDLGELAMKIDSDQDVMQMSDADQSAIADAIARNELRFMSAPLIAIIRSDDGEQTFDTPHAWKEALSERFSALSSKAAEKFWAANRGFILAVEEDHPEMAAILLDEARRRGLEPS